MALYPALRRLAAVVGPAEVEPDDLVQDAVARALRVGPLTELSNPKAYLSAAIVRLAANQRRSFGRRRKALVRLATAETGSAPSYPSDLAPLLALSPMDRAVLYLTTVEGATADEVAARLGGSAAAVRMRRTRAVRRLRAALKDDERHG